MQTFVLFKIRKKWQCLQIYDIIQVKISRFFVIIAVVIISFLYFRNKQLIPPDSNPEIELISVDYKKDGVYDTLDLSKNEISKDLNDRLVSILKHVKIRNKLLPNIMTGIIISSTQKTYTMRYIVY